MYSFIGKRTIRRDALAKTSGTLRFVNDLEAPGMLIGRILRSPYAFADIKRIDVSEAERIGAVTLTPDEVPQKPFNPRLVSVHEVTFKDTYVLTKKPRYIGDAVAAVAAPSEELAQRALESIRVEYERIYEPILDPFKAMEPGAPLIHEKIMKGSEWIRVEGNIAASLNYVEGDVDKAFQESDVVLERRFKTGKRYHMQLEPKAVLCVPEPGGKLTIYSTTQSIHNTRILVSQIFDIPLSRVNVVKIPIGGSFGSSIQVNYLVPIAVALCLKSGKPVKIAYTREEDILDHSNFVFHFRIKVGAKRNGVLTGAEFENTLDVGAHQVQPYPLLGTSLGWFVSMYKWRNIRYIGRAVYTNKTPACALRGYGAPEVQWAVETIMDELAEELGVDPVELRLKNYVGRGEIFWGQGPTVKSIIRSDGVPELLEKGKELIGWDKRGDPRGKKGRFRRGIGVARGFHTSGAGGPISGEVIDYTGCILKLNEDGTLDYITALQDHGGGTLDAHVKIISEVLGVPPELVNLASASTENTPYDVCTHASRGTYVGGEAARRAAEIVKSKIFEYAARLVGKAVNPEAFKIRYDEGLKQAVVYIEGTDVRIPLSEIARAAWQRNWGTIGAFVSYRATSAPPSFTVYFVEVEVDTWTGRVKPIRVVAGADVGTPVNPDMVEGQLHGGFAMAWGMAFTEDMVYEENGELAGRGLITDYKIPTIADVPAPEDFKVIIASSYEPTGPFGAKGIGEAAMNPAVGAIANAVYNAIGVRFYELPITPGKIVEALRKGGVQWD
ncbi:xanthine dehydrogenase family protein molybdopterin-binding subunit [Desulfurococcus mucosus]|uniref:Aldehyde oxidase and xanthine dehydrogenase molybdopterin binding protein n=1 Tax=Desulfurococcus mucosus (strain ATCC 35584 / DSM 2162 / JCM 9187 / O7/1) TaxID=765177 RepID=E8R8L4_DESM0|nr:molybdopterin cofactor-binding domain-containing protein [Desulfurococcus mucosus]ADV64840.1 aldehyde oxidase and xanthine dehydrogenase molybdopterin binding protein [Desulfurococcus mucosus DSM 2162]